MEWLNLPQLFGYALEVIFLIFQVTTHCLSIKSANTLIAEYVTREEHPIVNFHFYFSGYSRHLPGYDRYRMLGDLGSGVHDLEVTNVTLEDDGRFQCQVSPNRGQDAIRADAILTVLGK